MAAASAFVVGGADPLGAQAPTFEVALRDGTVLAAASVRGDLTAGFDVRPLQGPAQHLAAGAVLAIHGAAVATPALRAAHLAGGDVVHGTLAGGDSGGNRLDLLSPVLGTVPIAVDRLVLLAAAGAPPLLSLPLPDGVEEALFVRAAVGFDVLAGTLHQFGATGVRFQADGGEPRWFASSDFFALRLAQASPRAEPPAAWLLTRTADRLGVMAPRFGDEGLQCVSEGGQALKLRAADLGCVTFPAGVVFASDLEPIEVRETGCDGDVVWPWQRDRNALGGPLLVGGRAHAKGLGVHSKSRLSFRVPAGCERFWTRVGLDDSTAELPLQPDVDVRIEVDGVVVFTQRGLQAAATPRDSGLLPVVPGGIVVLEVDFGRGRDLGDRVDWLSPVFLPAPARRP